MCGVESHVIKQVTRGGMFDLALFADLVDLYVYLPPKDLNKDSNNSATMHYVLSSNSKGAATA